MSEEEREEFLKSTPERKLDIKDKKIDDILKLKDSQEQSSLPQPVIPAAPFLPDPQIANMFAANINPTTGLTQTESALLSPEEQIISTKVKNIMPNGDKLDPKIQESIYLLSMDILPD